MFAFFSLVPGINAGTTATVALLRDGIELVVASVGDSRAMLCRKGKALKLTVDHTPDRREEKERYQHIVSYAMGFLCRVLVQFGITFSPPLALVMWETVWLLKVTDLVVFSTQSLMETNISNEMILSS